MPKPRFAKEKVSRAGVFMRTRAHYFNVPARAQRFRKEAGVVPVYFLNCL